MAKRVFQVKPESLDANGTYQISAAADFNGTTASSKLPLYFTLQAANIVIANMVAANTSLESGASTNITLRTYKMQPRKQTKMALLSISVQLVEPLSLLQLFLQIKVM